VEIAQPLHLHHQFVLAQSGILRAQPVETFGRAQPLNVDEFEQVLKMVVPCRLMGAEKGLDRVRAAVVDRAEQFALDRVILMSTRYRNLAD